MGSKQKAFDEAIDTRLPELIPDLKQIGKTVVDHKTYLAPPSVKAPFTPEQIDTLNAYQADDTVHAYTCEHWHGDPAERRNLVATKDGWICRYCDYTQNWAHGSHFEKPK